MRRGKVDSASAPRAAVVYAIRARKRLVDFGWKPRVACKKPFYDSPELKRGIESMRTLIEEVFGEALAETAAGASLYMLSHEVNSEFPGSETPSEFGNGLTIAQEMDGLKCDLARLEQGWKPSAEELASAPVLEDWGIFDAGEALHRIVGNCVGASKIGNVFGEGEQMATLQILAIDHGLTWARDRRGFYRLSDISSME